MLSSQVSTAAFVEQARGPFLPSCLGTLKLALTIMGLLPPGLPSFWNDGEEVQLRMAGEVVHLDVVDVRAVSQACKMASERRRLATLLSNRMPGLAMCLTSRAKYICEHIMLDLSQQHTTISEIKRSKVLNSIMTVL